MGPGVTLSATQWDAPRHMREKIRAHFWAAHRPYHVAETNEGAIPAAQHIVRPNALTDPFVRWYEEPPPLAAAAAAAAAPNPSVRAASAAASAGSVVDEKSID